MILLALSEGHKITSILLADDDIDDRELFKEAVAATAPGVRFSAVGNGKELIDMLQGTVSTDLPDIVLLDLNMPLKGGQQCLTEIRADQRLRRLPVVIYSTARQEEQINDMYELGADYYIRKPSSYSGMKDIVRSLSSMAWDSQGRKDRKQFVLY